MPPETRAKKPAKSPREAEKKSRAKFSTSRVKKRVSFYEDVKDSASKTANRASKAFNFGAGWTRTIDSAIKTFQKTTGLDYGKSSASRDDRRFDGSRRRSSA